MESNLPTKHQFHKKLAAWTLKTSYSTILLCEWYNNEIMQNKAFSEINITLKSQKMHKKLVPGYPSGYWNFPAGKKCTGYPGSRESGNPGLQSLHYHNDGYSGNLEKLDSIRASFEHKSVPLISSLIRPILLSERGYPFLVASNYGKDEKYLRKCWFFKCPLKKDFCTQIGKAHVCMISIFSAFPKRRHICSLGQLNLHSLKAQTEQKP